jgi:hypothetical protein
MNQINPLHIGALLVTVILFLFVHVNSLKDELKEASEQYKKSEKLAVELSALKAVYGDKKRAKRAIERLLSQDSLKEANLKIQRAKSSIKISSPSLDVKLLNSLMGRFLNGSYQIEALKIKRVSQREASLYMEIKL